MNDEIPIIGQSIRGQTKASSGCRLERPPGEQTIELIVDVGIANYVTARIREQCALDGPHLLFFAPIFEAQKFEQFLISAFTNRVVQLSDLA